MNDEGYIKYRCIWNNTQIEIPEYIMESFNIWRKKLYNLSLIGVYNNGIGYGNISVRNDKNTFFITGSATGGKSVLNKDDYALVHGWDFRNNELNCTGKTKASSESLTHAAIYESVPEIKSVIHIHSEQMWNYYIDKIPATSTKVEFGTPEMAFELKRLLKDRDNKEINIVVMGGHKEGVITFGRNLDEAGNILLKYYYQSLNNSTISDPDSK